MAFYVHYLVLAPLVLLVLLAWTLQTRRPDRVLGAALATLPRRGGGRAVLGLYAFVVFGNLVQALLDDELTAALGYDLTGRVFALEGESVARVQEAVLALPAADLWVLLLGYAYTVGYVTWLLFPTVAFHALGKRRASGTYALAFALNYALALPFYLFAPVREVAWSGLSRARPLLEESFPGITANLRMESALDNCFPSLHVSIAVTSLVLVLHQGNRRMRLLAWPWTLAVCFSVLALGIHWVADTVTGVPHGLLCAWLALRWWPPGGEDGERQDGAGQQPAQAPTGTP